MAANVTGTATSPQAAQERAAERANEQAAEQIAQQAAQTAREAIRDAQRQIRDAQRQAGRSGRDFQPEVGFAQFPGSGPQIPEGAVIISVAFFVMCAVIAIGLPIARAIARRSDRGNTGALGADSDTRARLERIEQAVESIAVEVERISEGQRFTTKVIAELRTLPAGDPAAGLVERAGDRVAVPLSRTREAR